MGDDIGICDGVAWMFLSNKKKYRAWITPMAPGAWVDVDDIRDVIPALRESIHYDHIAGMISEDV